MDLKPGERVLAESESTERPPRAGTVEDVLAPGRYRIRWDDGRETIYTPAAGAIYRESESHQSTAVGP
jgi:hypothetical protein